MAKRMLIDAAHPEETRVVVTSGTRLEDFDFESSTKKQVKGNIYLAKVTRVEPSLQAAFIDYGGNRHGFLAFSEIHPDYYRIPVSDRQGGAAGGQPGDDDDGGDNGGDTGVPLFAALPEPVSVPQHAGDDDGGEPPRDEILGPAAAPTDQPPEEPDPAAPPAWSASLHWDAPAEAVETAAATPLHDNSAPSPDGALAGVATAPLIAGSAATEVAEIAAAESAGFDAENGDDGADEQENVETFGGDEVEEVEEADAERRRFHPARHYKIQEVIKRRQIMLVQVAKEERGNKGAALTTYLSLAGRYCVLMPNTNRGGGVSRKITSIADRRRLKDILEELEIPEGMGVIVRTAGAERSKAEIKRDYEYLLRLWNEIRDLTLKSTAPALIYEEGNLIKRSIRDLYARDIEEVLVEGDEAYKTAKAFMRTLMPSHAKRVQPYRDPQIGLFHRFQIETQIDAIYSPVAQLRSGGYLVINQTEALVSIDVNSGRSTRERNIEETALRTNLEAADEIARQLRLRDLAGLIVIDFIDMEEHRNQVAVERRLKDALKNDRARIQVGRISPFGLLEMSRQRLRPSLTEASTQPCPHCGGTGHIRSVESAALHVLRSIEEEGIRRRAVEMAIYVPITVALYILNQKRDSLHQIETRYGIKVTIQRDDSLVPPAFRLERLRPFAADAAAPPRAVQAPSLAAEEEEEGAADEPADAAEEAAAEPGGDDRGRRRRPRRRRRTREPRETAGGRESAAASEPSAPAAGEAEAPHEGESERRRRRRGRRGGRTRLPREEAAEGVSAGPVTAETIEIVASIAETVETDGAEFARPETLGVWSAEAGVETASLAPLAGEPAQPEAAAPTEPELGGEAQPTAEAEAGVPFASEAERVLEGAGAAAAAHPVPPPPEAPHPSDDVLTITEKPANPRRGWWQRLIQP